MPDDTIFKAQTDVDATTPFMTLQKWGGLASFLMAVALFVAPLIYLVGDLRHAIGPFAYSLADFLYGPKDAAGADTYVLCEINVSSVYPFPDEALAPLAAATRARLDARR